MIQTTRTSRRIPPKLYRIGELVTYANVSRQTIHNYTTMGLLQESSWSSGGHRLYDEAAFARLDEIAELKARHLSIQEIRQLLAQRLVPAAPADGSAAAAPGEENAA